MRLLMIGDVIAQTGCDFLRQKLPGLKRQLKVDVVIANGENSAVGNGILPHSAKHLLDSGVDIITTGNHVYKRREVYPYLEESEQVIRPANFRAGNPGRGYCVYDAGSFTMLVVNLMGTSYMEPLENPFDTIDRILEEDSAKDAKYVVVDFHAEATGEKKAMAYYLDGKVSVVAGTHTHVQTADAQILPDGTGYITDLGMTGPVQSVLGIVPDNIIARLRTAMPTRFEVPENLPCQLDGCLFDLDEKSGKCVSVERISLR